MSPRIATGLLALVLACPACREATVQSSNAPQTVPTVIPANATQIPAGTPFLVSLQNEISTAQSHPGDEVRATLTTPVVDAAGHTLVPQGAELQGRVTAVAPSKHAGDEAAIKVDFTHLAVNGQAEPVQTEITDTKPKVEQDTGRAKKGAAIGAASGAVLGGILGKSVKGVLIGGALGGAAGTGISLGTGEVDAKLPAGTPMTVKLTQNAPLP